MFQESADKMKGTIRSDTVLFIILIVFFFAAGSVATVLKNHFNSNIPLYVFAAVLGGLILLVYRLRLTGYRYTIFYKEPETEYDERFGEEITHEDYPYPIGTIVVERIVSAKGQILEVILKEELEAILEPGEQFAADEELSFSTKKNEASRSIVFRREGRTYRMYFAPSDEFKKYVETVLEG